MPDRAGVGQEDFEPFDNGERPFYYDRPLERATPPPMRPDQMLLRVPHLEEMFVIPRWTANDVPPGWTFVAAELNTPRLTQVQGRFIFRRDTDTRFVGVWVEWSEEWSRLTAQAGDPNTWELLEEELDDDADRLEDVVLQRVVRYVDLLSMVGAAAMLPDMRRSLLEAIGVGPGQELT